MPEKVFAVITVARQIDGEYVFVKAEKAFKKASQADELKNKLKAQFTTTDGKIKFQKISTPNGEADCFMEIGSFELEVEE